MKHKGFFRFAILILLGLGVILSLTVTNIFNFSGKKELKEISIILKETDNFINSSMHKGMQSAAIDYGAELRTLTPTKRNSHDEQESFLTHEIEIGTDAIIINPANTNEISNILNSLNTSVPIISLNSDIPNTNINAVIGINYDEAITNLCEIILKSISNDSVILLLNNSKDNIGITNQVELCEKILKENSYETQTLNIEHSNILAEVSIHELQEINIGAIIAFETLGIEQAVTLSSFLEQSPAIYGFSTNANSISYLDNNEIDILIAQNDFAIGYLSVQNAIKAIKKEKNDVDYVPYGIIYPYNIYTAENEKLLFPVT